MKKVLSRRDFLKFGSGALLTAGGVSLRLLPTDAQPQGCNVLFLMTDEHHHAVMACAGNPIVRTPNLDRLAAEGVRFTQASVPTPFCSPTRASILTGLYPHRHGITKNIDGTEKGVDNSWTTTEGILFDRGCFTAHRGKWHLGSRNDVRYYREVGYAGESYNRFLEERCPAKQFKEDEGQAKLWGRPLYMTPAALRAHEEWLNQPRRYKQDGSLIGRTPISRECLPESYFTDQVIALLRQNRDRRFMITCSYSPPHAFWVICEPYYSMYDRKAIPLPPSYGQCPAHLEQSLPRIQARQLGEDGVREMVGCYYGQVTFIDWNVGRILDALKELGLEQNTLVLFTSDHGDYIGAHGMVGKGGGMQDELMRVPLILRYPGRIRAGAVTSVQASSVDLMPTILDYAGLKTPDGIHGRSLRPFIEGRPDDGRPAFCEHTGPNFFLRAIRTHDWKYVYSDSDKIPAELYDLRNDPYEMRSLAAEPAHQKTVRDLRQRLKDWMTATGDAAVTKMKETA